ncbi:hypothetical protein [Treponema endosymbiont of Eucomonympha sp.]|nr:hypothetical protein [Treponema endosymbiont of Eucomonympha sp.]
MEKAFFMPLLLSPLYAIADTDTVNDSESTQDAEKKSALDTNK